MIKTAVVVSNEGCETKTFDSKDEYNFLSEAVGGDIEAVTLQGPLNGLIMWVNEEGKIIGLPDNGPATTIWASAYGLTDIMAGTAVITGASNDNGVTRSLTLKQISAIEQVASDHAKAIWG
jgi:hypothetical protein